MGKSIALAGLLVFLLGLIVFQYYITSVPDLEEPITISEARFMEEDASLLVSLVDNEGQRFTVGLRGDIATKPEETALFFISNPDLVPYVYWPGLRSNDEKRVLKLLESWAENHAEPSRPKAQSANSDSALSQEKGKATAAYQIYSVLKDRN